MHRSLATAAFAAGAALLAACSNESRPQQGRAVAYGPTAYAPSPQYAAPAPSTAYAPSYAPSYAPGTAYSAPRVAPPPPPSPDRTPVAMAGPAPAPAPAYSAGWRWHTRLADAQADARAQGKLILLASTRPGCGLCEKFKNQVVPQSVGQLQTMAVGYYFDITAPEDGRADQIVRSNLRGATLMPLCGFVTPDLQWVSGFWGPTDAGKFSADMATARRLYPVHATFVAPKPAGAPAVAMVNEYGEYEWSAAEEVAPEDAIGPEAGAPTPPAPTPVLAAAPVAPEPARVAVEPAMPVVAEAPAPCEPAAVPCEPATAPSLPAPVVAERTAAPVSTPEWTAPSGDAAASVTWSSAATSPAATPATSETPAAAIAPAPGALAPAASESPEAWGEAMLARALEQLRAGELDAARVTLTQVLARLPDSDLGLDAARGTVAIYSVRKIAKADVADRATLAERAQRDLSDTRWSVLFR